SKGEHIKREHHVLLAFEVVQINLLAFSIGKGEVGSGLAHLQMRPGRRGLGRAWRRRRGCRLLRKHRHSQTGQQQDQRCESLNHFCRLLSRGKTSHSRLSGIHGKLTRIPVPTVKKSKTATL